jgi:hypothetical protein
MHRRIVASISLAMFIAGCSTPALRTAPARVEVCDDALAGGRLVTSRQSGLALVPSGNEVIPVMWLFGYSSRPGLSGVELVDESGQTLAHEGDFVQIGGGLGADGFFAACAGTVKLVPAPS